MSTTIVVTLGRTYREFVLQLTGGDFASGQRTEPMASKMLRVGGFGG